MGAAHKLSPAKVTQIARAKQRGLYGDGKGLWLQVSAFGTTAWLFRYMIAGKARGMGLGAYPDTTLKEARDLAADARKLIRSGVDPITERKAKKIAAQVEAAKQVTFAKCVEEYLEAHSKSWRNAVHRRQWKSTLEDYANPIIGNLPVAAVDTALVLKILRPLWDKKTETASRLRGRIERVLAWATVSTYRAGENPARWHGHLKEMLPAKNKVRKPVHHKALPYGDTPAFMSKLRYEESVSAKALEFTILNATRTNETIGAKWGEIDLAAKVWTIPAARMKMDRPHRVPLSDRAVAILSNLPRDGDDADDYVFPGAREGKPLSNMAMLELVRGMLGKGHTVHGFRSSFRDWCKEQTNYPREIAELALAHSVADKSEAAYSRGDALDKRRPLMRDWSTFCATKPRDKDADNVVAIHEARA
jgi:integrase